MSTRHRNIHEGTPRQGRRRPIRVVPLHVPGELAGAKRRAAVPAKLTYRGGPLLSQVQVTTVFWGTGWQDPAQQALAGSLNAFFRFVVSSSFLDQLAEYSAPHYTIGRGSFAGTATITDEPLGQTVADADIQQMLERHVAAKALPASTPNSLYFVFLPPGVAVVTGSDRSCQVFCGYHDRSAGGLYYAVVPSPDCAGCLGGLKPLDALTSVASHELGEAITDPVPGQGWYDDTHGENGDICAWENKQLGDWTVQKLWSNRAAACV